LVNRDNLLPDYRHQLSAKKGESPENAQKPLESPETASEGESKGEIDITGHGAAELVA
jgi:hypothetical protein